MANKILQLLFRIVVSASVGAFIGYIVGNIVKKKMKKKQTATLDYESWFRSPKLKKDGTGFETDPFYTEIFKLREMLIEAGIPHRFQELFDGWQVGYPRLPIGDDVCICSAVEHFGSYGSAQNLIEIMGLLTDEELEDSPVLGHLTADEVFERIKAHWDKTKEE